jgi:hypothetical protein
MLIVGRSNCIVTASGIVTLSKRPYSAAFESGIKELCIKLVIETVLNFINLCISCDTYYKPTKEVSNSQQYIY